MSTSSLHKLPPGSTLGSVPVDIRCYAAENPGARDRAGVVRSGGGILNNQPLFPAISGHLRGHLRSGVAAERLTTANVAVLRLQSRSSQQRQGGDEKMFTFYISCHVRPNLWPP